MTRRAKSRLAHILLAICALAPAAFADEPPATPIRPVQDTYHGVVVTDDYRWLENWDDPAVRAWSDAQSAYARRVLDALPHVAEIRERITELVSDSSGFGSLAYAGGRIFAMKRQPPLEQRFLVVADSTDGAGSARVIVDPNKLDPSARTTIDWYAPSPDGKLVAVSLSVAGTESGVLHVFAVDTAAEVYERVPAVNSGTAGGSAAWSRDSKGLYYTRHFPVAGATDGRVYQQVYYHALGTSTDSDRYELGRGFPEIAEIQLRADPRTERVLAVVQKGDGGEFAHYLRGRDGQWQQFTRFEDRVVQVEFGPDDDLLAVSLAGSPRGRIVRVPAKTLDARGGTVVVPESDAAIVTGGTAFTGENTIVATAGRLYVVYQLGGPSEIRVLDYSGKRLPAPTQLEVSTISGLTRLNGEEILFGNESYLTPHAFYRYDPVAGRTTETSFADTSAASFADATVVRELATSADGTKVPLNIVARKGTPRDGSTPALVTGYGGFGISIEPAFSPVTRMLLDQGMIFVQTNLRGGTEFGEAWHRAGSLKEKQHVFDDFEAVLDHLIARGYTSSAKLAITGRSNGGLLMGATLTQRPELAKVVVAGVGIYDMLRYELSPNGAFNTTEYGSVRDAEQFKALYAYSPYQHVKKGVHYPATLFYTGANDPRVDPMHSRKMTAALQAAVGSSVPILLRTSANAGHGLSSLSAIIEQNVDVYAFIFDRLGIDFRAPAR